MRENQKNFSGNTLATSRYTEHQRNLQSFGTQSKGLKILMWVLGIAVIIILLTINELYFKTHTPWMDNFGIWH